MQQCMQGGSHRASTQQPNVLALHAKVLPQKAATHPLHAAPPARTRSRAPPTAAAPAAAPPPPPPTNPVKAGESTVVGGGELGISGTVSKGRDQQQHDLPCRVVAWLLLLLVALVNKCCDRNPAAATAGQKARALGRSSPRCCRLTISPPVGRSSTSSALRCSFTSSPDGSTCRGHGG